MRKFLPLLLAASTVVAQEEPVEVRRAEPAVPPAVPRAQPVTPVAAPAAVPPTADAVAPGEIRALPSAAVGDPVAAALEQANAFYQQKMFQLAADKYREFLQLRPQGADRQPALFRLGESLRELKREEVRQRTDERRQARTLQQLIAVGQARGMKNPVGWAKHVYFARGQR